jgi:hypothetical protein
LVDVDDSARLVTRDLHRGLDDITVSCPDLKLRNGERIVIIVGLLRNLAILWLMFMMRRPGSHSLALGLSYNNAKLYGFLCSPCLPW